MSVKQIESQKYIVYEVVDPLTYQIRYIGITKNLEKRMREHKHWALRGTRRYFYNWYRSVLKQNNTPIFNIVTVCKDYNSACEEEKCLIGLCKYLTIPLCNSTEGGDGLFNPSEETISKIKHKRKTQVFSLETREKMRQARLGRKFGKRSIETRIKMSNTHKEYWIKKKSMDMNYER